MTSKELEALNKLFVLSSEYHQKLWCLKLAPVYPEAREKYIDRIVKCLPNDAGELNDLYDYIKQALERNEPMKVLIKEARFGPFAMPFQYDFCCPSCKKVVGVGTSVREPVIWDYCPDCGQKLDWSDKNDK